MSDLTIEDALDYLDNVCVCHGCECWQDHDWGGCYRTTTTGKMACDLRDEAVEVLRKVVFRAMGAKDINVPDKTAKVETVEKPNVFKCSECGQYFHSTAWGSPVEYCSRCGAKLDWNEDIPMEYFESGGK